MRSEAASRRFSDPRVAERQRKSLCSGLTLKQRGNSNPSLSHAQQTVCRPATTAETAASVLADRLQLLRASGRLEQWSRPDDPDFPTGDIDKALDADRFSFVMPGTRQELAGIVYVSLRKQAL